MIGIRQIGCYIPENRIQNEAKLEKHGINRNFIEEKIGIRSVSRKGGHEKASDLCIKAFEDLLSRCDPCELDPRGVDFVCVCTQNGDYQLPQTSSVLHGKIGLPSTCATFDISLGCSGYVYSILVGQSFMEAANLNRGIVFTCDPYSGIIDPDDKNTDLLFGDAASATLLCESPHFEIGRGVFETDGKSHQFLIKHENKKLFMNGRGIFNFTLRHVPSNVKRCLDLNRVLIEDIDVFIFHQANKFMLDSLADSMSIDPRRVPFEVSEYGNTVSSSIPIVLKNYIHDRSTKIVLLSGFGVGLSVASVVLRRI